jgi:opacity protein-like surface antigen
MRIRRSGPIAVIAALLLLAGAASADDYFRKGFYLNASAAYGFSQMDTTILGASFQVPPLPLQDKNSWGLNVRAGTQVYSWLAFELEYEWMKSLNIVQSNGATLASYEPDVVTVNAKFILPLWRVQPYLLVGGGVAIFDVVFPTPWDTLSVSDSGFAFRGGAGLDVFITKHIAVNVESTYLINTSAYTNAPFGAYPVPTIDNLYYLAVSGGITYHF